MGQPKEGCILGGKEMSSDIQSTKNSVYTQSSFEERLPNDFNTYSSTIAHYQAAFA